MQRQSDSDDGDAVRFWPAAALTPDTVAAIIEQVRILALGNSMSGLPGSMVDQTLLVERPVKPELADCDPWDCSRR